MLQIIIGTVAVGDFPKGVMLFLSCLSEGPVKGTCKINFIFIKESSNQKQMNVYMNLVDASYAQENVI